MQININIGTTPVPTSPCTYDDLCVLVHGMHTQLEEINMKLSAIKAQIAEAAKNSAEAFSELSSRLADQQTKIDQLVADAQDPEVPDDEFLANLKTVSDNNRELASIVPNPPVEPPAPPTEEPTVPPSEGNTPPVEE